MIDSVPGFTERCVKRVAASRKASSEPRDELFARVPVERFDPEGLVPLKRDADPKGSGDRQCAEAQKPARQKARGWVGGEGRSGTRTSQWWRKRRCERGKGRL